MRKIRKRIMHEMINNLFDVDAWLLLLLLVTRDPVDPALLALRVVAAAAAALYVPVPVSCVCVCEGGWVGRSKQNWQSASCGKSAETCIACKIFTSRD